MIPTPDAGVELLALAAALGGIPAPCQVGDPDDWHHALDLTPAIEACGACHAVTECGAYAVSVGAAHGVWGGRSFDRKRKGVAA